MPPDPSIARMVVYRSRTGFDVPAVIAATRETLFEPGVRAFRESEGTRGVPPLSSPDHVHLIVFSPGLPQQPVPVCRRCGGPIGVGQPHDEVAITDGGGFVHRDADDCTPDRGRLTDQNMGGTFREWDVPLWEPHSTQPNVPGALPTAAEPDLGSWRWPVIR